MTRLSRNWLTALCLAVGTATEAHSQAAGVDTVYHLHGTVINGVTGKPLSRALVTSGDRRLATMTGNEGQFSIDLSVPPGRPVSGRSMQGRFSGGALNLSAQKPGYIAPFRPAFLSIDDSISSNSIELKLMPAGVVTGRVSSVATDAASNVRVMLFRRQILDGRRVWAPSGTQNTNSRGGFRFSDLFPGEYTLMTAEWQDNQPNPRPRTEASERYPPVFDGDVPSLNSATKFTLHYGDTVAADFHLHLATYYPVVIPISNTDGPVSAQLDSPGGFQLGYNARDGAVEGALPNGDYNFTLSGRNSDRQPTFAVLQIHVAGSAVHTAPVQLVTPSAIEVRIHTDFTKPENATPSVIASRPGRNGATGTRGELTQVQPLVQVVLRAENNPNAYANTRPNAAGNPVLEKVPPGRYFVEALPFRGYVASMTSGGGDLLRHELVVGAGGRSEPIDITLRDDTATLNGTVTHTTAAQQTSMILLLPVDTPARYTQAFAGPDGKFSISNLSPGSYLVLAFSGDGGFPQIAWHDPEVMHQYDGKGSSITIAAGETQSVNLNVLDETDRADQ